MKPVFQRSLSYRLAGNTVLVGAILGLVMSGFLVFQDLLNERRQINAMIRQSVAAVYQSAAQAAYEIDAARAHGALSGIFQNRAIKKINIEDDFGTILAQQSRPDDSHGSDWLVDLLFGEKLVYSEPLIWENDGKRVGNIQVWIDGRHVAHDFFIRSIRTLIGAFALVFILAGVYTLLFYYSMIRPVLGIVRQVSSVDTDNPGEEYVDIPKHHEDNEIGRLASALNKLIRGYSASLALSREAEAKVRQSESRYRLLIENSPLGIVTINTEGEILDVNSKILEILGSPSTDSTRGINMLSFPPLIEAGISRNVQQSLKTGRAGVFETLYTSKWGRQSSMKYHLQPIRDENDRITGVQGVVEDVSETKRLENQLQQAQKMEAVGTLAGGIAHDFNNILQAIKGYTEMILMDKKENDPDYFSLKAIEKAGERAAQLVRQLLFFSRKVETARKPVDLNQEVVHAGKILERTIPKMIDIELHPSGRLWPVKADPVQIEQILLNLGSNAADAMPDGGTLVIETENVTMDEEFAQNHVGAYPGKYVVISVSDTGYGMDKDTVEHIFEPFYTTKDVGKGTGLGLASVYGIVKSHGGYIHCESEVGQGTLFKVYMPAVEKLETVSMKELTDEHPKGGTETILLVDDEDAVREFGKQGLELYGYTVMAASSGEEALTLFSSKKDEIDVVILDIGMPGMGGHRCLGELLQMDASTKVVIASGYSLNGQVKRTLASGAAGFIAKPYRLVDLLKKVRAVLEESD